MTKSRSRASRKTYKVMVALSHRLLREGITRILQDGGFDVIGEAQTVQGLRQLAAQQAPNIFLLVGDLPDGGREAIDSLGQEFERSVVAVVKPPQSSEAIMEDMQAGATGYLSLNLSPEEFVNSLRMIGGGDVIVSREMTEQLSHSLLSARAEEQPIESLSGREREVLSLVAQGATNREIAGTLIITENTVKVHLRNILDKLDLRNRQQAAAFAAQEGLVEEAYVTEDEEPT